MTKTIPITLAVLHTSFVFINVEPVLKNLFKEYLPNARVIDFVDGDILAAVNREGSVQRAHVERMVHLTKAAEAAGADLIFSACSSLGPAIDVARKQVSVPIIKIDDPMTSKAVAEGTRIGVMATVPTTLGPTMDLLQAKAAEAGKTIEIIPSLSRGAFDALMSGDRERHDQMLLEGARELAPQVDLIVLAQASMSRLAPSLSEAVGKEVLGSPRLAVEHLKDLVEAGPGQPA